MWSFSSSVVLSSAKMTSSADRPRIVSRGNEIQPKRRRKKKDQNVTRAELVSIEMGEEGELRRKAGLRV